MNIGPTVIYAKVVRQMDSERTKRIVWIQCTMYKSFIRLFYSVIQVHFSVKSSRYETRSKEKVPKYKSRNLDRPSVSSRRP